MTDKSECIDKSHHLHYKSDFDYRGAHSLSLFATASASLLASFPLPPPPPDLQCLPRHPSVVAAGSTTDAARAEAVEGAEDAGEVSAAKVATIGVFAALAPVPEPAVATT